MLELFFTSLVCFCIKLNAIAMQQKLIGERLGTSLRVRAMIGVNSVTVRAIKMILMKPGLSPDKVFILCGGPDWPTSVTTGILKLSLPSMLCGSVPVILLVAPCVCAGGFLLRRNDKTGPWAAVSDVSIAVASIFQFGAMLAALYYIEQVAHNNRDELSRQVLDEEVAEIDEKQHKRAELYERLTDWHDPTFPKTKKLQLKLGAALLTCSVYLCMGLDSLCFRKFGVTSKIGDPFDAEDPGLEGNALNLVKPIGWGAIIFFTIGYALLSNFRKWARRRVKDATRAQFHHGVQKSVHVNNAITVMEAGVRRWISRSSAGIPRPPLLLPHPRAKLIPSCIFCSRSLQAPGGRARHVSVADEDEASHVQNPVTATLAASSAAPKAVGNWL